MGNCYKCLLRKKHLKIEDDLKNQNIEELNQIISHDLDNFCYKTIRKLKSNSNTNKIDKNDFQKIVKQINLSSELNESESESLQLMIGSDNNGLIDKDDSIEQLKVMLKEKIMELIDNRNSLNSRKSMNFV